ASPKPPVSALGAPTMMSAGAASAAPAIPSASATPSAGRTILLHPFVIASSPSYLSSSGAEIGAPYELGIGQHLAVAAQHHAPVGEDQPSARAFEAGGVLLDEQDRGAGGTDRHQALENEVGHQRRQAERGLVEHQEPRRVHHGAADRQHLLLA